MPKMLSKSDFLLYLEAPMHLWAKSHGQVDISSHTAFEQHLIQQGQQIEALAREYLERYVLPRYNHSWLFWQPSYNDGQFQIRADALVLDQETNSYDLYEIKSSTSVKKEHIYDLTFQALVLEMSLDLRNVYLLHIDNTYQHQLTLNLEQFFTVEEISQKVYDSREDVGKLRQLAWDVVQMDHPEPEFACVKPKFCPCPSLCHPNLAENPIYNLPRLGKRALDLLERGIFDIKDIPSSINLSGVQQKHVQAVKTGQPVIDLEAIKQSLSSLTYPLYFLDYETFNPAVPLFSNYHPYEHIVFQYSLFVIKKPGSQPQHHECLLTEPSDPAPKIVPHLLQHLGAQGSVVVWNQSFEANRNKDLAAHCHAYAAQLMSINDRLYDLMLIFRDGHYVHPNFHGSASLKAVLPVLCPDLQYEKLAISSGEEAMLTWYWLQTGKLSQEDLTEIKMNMLEYCKLDTYGMLAIWEKLQSL